MVSTLKVPSQFSRVAQALNTNKADQVVKQGRGLNQQSILSQDAVRLSLTKTDGLDDAKIYNRLSAKPPSDVNVDSRRSDGRVRPEPIDAKPAVKPVPPPDAGAPSKTFDGLYRQEKDGSTTVAFDGIQLSIKKDGTVEGSIVGPDGKSLAIKGTYKDGQITADVEKIGSYSATLSFAQKDGIKGADGQVVLSNLKQIEPAPTPTKPKPPEQINVDGVYSGDTAYFGGFNLTFGKGGEVAVELNSPDGRKVYGKGTINDKGEITVRFDDPKSGFDGATYSAVFSRDGKDGGNARLSDVRFLGNFPPPESSAAVDLAV